ncbi:hypothetical protein GCM10023091_23580 [Ravibacter arvi]|uniref:Transposase n=1 Tax=Ravibacter arvi TaxID=2051041 RepID=A0ABP8LY83_9BACT
MYEQQTLSKKDRKTDKSLIVFRLCKLYDQLNTPYFKKKYAGKPTKIYQRLMEQIRFYENILIKTG